VTIPLVVLLCAAPNAADLLARVDAILSPDRFEAEVTMVTIRPDSEERRFSMKIWKSGEDLHRIRFLTPADDKGTEVLRVGDEMWNYLPNLKRSLRISAKQEFHGGDFSNADVLRSSLAHDYQPRWVESSADEHHLELTAKNDQVAYQTLQLWVRKSDAMPLREELFTSSGKKVRTMEYLEPKTYGKVTRPSRLVMHNALNASRRSELIIDTMVVRPTLNEGLFKVAALGR
jgi:outer membrane lipoprotein-sorting protein